MHILAQWLLSAICLLIVTYFVPGFKITGFVPALIAAVAIGVLNATLWWVLMVFTLPLNIITFGLFTFVVNAIVLRVASAFVPGFTIEGWGPAIWGALVLAITGAVLRFLFGGPQT